MRAPFAFASVLAVIASAASARGQSAPIHELRYDVALDATIAASGAVFWFGTELAKPVLAPATCRWCDRDQDGNDTLNSVDASARSLRWSSSGSADAISNVLGMAAIPAAAVGLDALASFHDGGNWKRAGVDALLIAEAAFVATAINQTVKYAVGRERPFVHALPPGQKGATANPADNNLSFFSQHTTWTFALATASGTVASMRGYRLAPLVWGVGMPLAAATGYLRIAADKHYLTDVVVGALFGAAVGAAVPLLAHGRQDGGAATTGTASAPVMVAVAGVF